MKAYLDYGACNEYSHSYDDHPASVAIPKFTQWFQPCALCECSGFCPRLIRPELERSPQYRRLRWKKNTGCL